MPAKWVKNGDGTHILESRCDFCSERAPFINRVAGTATCRCLKHWLKWQGEKGGRGKPKKIEQLPLFGKGAA